MQAATKVCCDSVDKIHQRHSEFLKEVLAYADVKFKEQQEKRLSLAHCCTASTLPGFDELGSIKDNDSESSADAINHMDSPV
jgi:hypothetical protein